MRTETRTSRANAPSARARRRLLVGLLTLAVLIIPPAAPRIHAENGVLSAGGVLKGNYHHLRFIIPLRGDFSQYKRVEVVSAVSEVGHELPAEKREKYQEWMRRMFAETGLFEEVLLVEKAAVNPAAVAAATPQPWQSEFVVDPAALGLLAAPENESDLLVARSWKPVVVVVPDFMMEELLQEAALSPNTPPPIRTLVVTSTVMDYQKGNRGLRMLGLGFGASRFTARFAVYDKETGEELARGNVTGTVEESSLGLPGNSSSDNSMKVAAADFVRHVEKRVRNADR